MISFPKTKLQELKEQCSEEVLSILESNERVSLDKYKILRLNGYERFFLFPLLEDEAVIYVIENALKNSKANEYKMGDSYDDFLQNQGIVVLFNRFKQLVEETSPQGKLRKLLTIKKTKV